MGRTLVVTGSRNAKTGSAAVTYRTADTCPSYCPLRDAAVFDEMVQDPQCKTYVPKREAVKRTVAGTAHFFCSVTCADKFEKGA